MNITEVRVRVFQNRVSSYDVTFENGNKINYKKASNNVLNFMENTNKVRNNFTETTYIDTYRK